MRSGSRHPATWLGALLVPALLLAGGPPAQGEEPFPTKGWLPKAETGADRFLKAHPTYDGRGVVVAIFDSGVDPGAAGLQTTTEGKPKIVDLLDGSGSGDVDTSTVRKAEHGAIQGLSGRRLSLGDGLTCPTGEWHVGLKPAYEFFPRGLVRRLRKERRKNFDEQQRVAETRLQAQVVALANSAEKDAEEQREDLAIRLESLRTLAKKYEDPGPVFDCVVFHDGKTWRAVLDTDADGDLADEKALAPFREERQFGTFGAGDRLNYGINVYRDGDLLSVVVDSGAHGTHVAGIVAAHFPDQPELNGVAPGAQIVSVKIGDTRVGPSTGSGEERGVAAVLRAGCDLINMSYGGPEIAPDRSRSARLYTEVVNEHGVIFVASAGNDGPGLSTVGGPGGTTSAIFGVGAYVSAAMMKSQHTMRKTVPPVQYTWSACGPTTDGDLGVDFSAPGGAVAPVPNWALQRGTHMAGTSMSSPNLCGGIALLLSALKAQDIPSSPARIRRALANTARQVEGIEVFTLGRGVIQLPAAHDYLVRWKEKVGEDARFEVRLPDRGDTRGLYLREPFEANRVVETRVRVKPHFPEAADHGKRIDFELQVNLKCTAPWVEAGDHLLLRHGGERFGVRVDPTGLAPGKVHYAEVQGFDASAPERGPLFHLPVTVVRPETSLEGGGRIWKETLRFEPGQVQRRFLAVPPGATWADLRIRTADQDAGRLLVLQAIQLLPGRTYADGKFEDWLFMERHAEEVRSFRVTGGRTLELCCAQFWNSLGQGAFDAELTFHGLQPSSERVCVDGGKLLARVDVTAALHPERLAPEVKLTTLRKRLRPKTATIRPLDAARDTLPGKRRVHELILEYEIQLEAPARVRPLAFHAEGEEIYDEWTSSLWMVFDANKRRVGVGPIWRDKTLSLAKGAHVLRLHLRHADPARLEAVKEALLFLDVKLGKALRLPVFASALAALEGKPRFEARTLKAGERTRIYLGALATRKLPKQAEPGDELHGEITYGEAQPSRVGSGRRPDGYPIWVLVPPAASKAGRADARSNKKAAGPPTRDEIEESVRDLRVAKLAALRKAEAFDAFDRLAREILARHPGHLPVRVEQLERYDGRGPPYAEKGRRGAVLRAAECVLARIDRERIAAHFGTLREPEGEDEAALRKRMTLRRDALREALFRKARALASAGEAKREAFREAFATLEGWVDTKKGRYIPLRIQYERSRGRLGAVLQLLGAQQMDGAPKKKVLEARATLFEELGWAHWAAYERRWMSIRFPPAYPPF